MPTVPEKMTAFVAEHHVLTLATSCEGVPYAAPLFYAYDAERNRFIFASGAETEHAKQMLENPSVAAGIYLETETVGKIQGLQCLGTVVPADDADKKCYFGRYPYARALQPTLWRLEPTWMKLTDNRLGFGKKLLWEAIPSPRA
jgi:uncharacterized protein YhbP (UPF0306 family)